MAEEKRFETVYHKSGFASPSTTILVDKQTGINYLFVQNGYGGGLTPLLKADGTVVVTPVSRYDK